MVGRVVGDPAEEAVAVAARVVEEAMVAVIAVAIRA